MADLTAQRTLVKSPPELWSELSEVESLARHLGELGEIRITKVEPESTVAWEGEEVSGTVELEQSGWGTKVTFRATVPDPTPEPEPTPIPAPELESERVAVAESEPVAAADAEPVAVAEPESVAAAEPGSERREPEPVVTEAESQGFFARWLFRRRQPTREPVAIEPEPVAIEPAPVAVEAEPIEPERVAVPIEPAPVAVEPEPAAEPEPLVASAADHVQQVLDGTLDTLGQAHHRPFSRG